MNKILEEKKYCPEELALAFIEIGKDLCRLRQSRGWSDHDVCKLARVPLKAVDAIEQGQVKLLGAPIYAIGYLRAYARLVGLSFERIESVALLAATEPVELLASSAIRQRPQWSARWFGLAKYAALTSLIVLPVLYLTHKGENLAATSGRAFVSGKTTIELDAPVVAASSAGILSTHDDAQEKKRGTEDSSAQVIDRLNLSSLGVQPGAAHSVFDAPNNVLSPPLMASLTPMPGTHKTNELHVVLKVDSSSWVQMLGQNGEKIEYGLLPKGSRREYVLTQPVSLKIGNAAAVVLELNGERVDLSAHTYSNVANLELGERTQSR
jgi:cytoskeleton protein RodZ